MLVSSYYLIVQRILMHCWEFNKLFYFNLSSVDKCRSYSMIIKSVALSCWCILSSVKVDNSLTNMSVHKIWQMLKRSLKKLFSMSVSIFSYINMHKLCLCYITCRNVLSIYCLTSNWIHFKAGFKNWDGPLIKWDAQIGRASCRERV